jgi:hypothetical protein
MNYYRNREALVERAEQSVKDEDWNSLREVIAAADDCSCCELIIEVVLPPRYDTSKKSDCFDGEAVLVDGNKVPSDLIDLALDKFSATDNRMSHDGWTHSLSHFTRRLWAYGYLDWIKRFNEQAFGNAEEGWGFDRAYSCCDRLVVDVAEYGGWDTDPAAIGLTKERIQKVADQYNLYYFARVCALPFASAVAADIWKAKWYLSDSARISRHMHSSEIIDFFVAEQIDVLVKAGEDISLYAEVIENLRKGAAKDEE